MEQPQIGLNQTSSVSCPTCKSIFFKEILIMRKVSRFITGAPADSITPIPVIVCDQCKTILHEALPPALAQLFQDDAAEIIEEEPESPTTGAKIIQMYPR